MNLLFRLAWYTFWSFFRKKISPLESSTISLRVLPTDLDVMGHMNNGRYLTLMDIARTEMTSRMGIVGPMLKKRWYPVVASQKIQYKKSLGLFQKYQIKTWLSGWDEKWFYISQEFIRNDRVCAVAKVKGLFLSPGGQVPTAELLKLVGFNGESPILSEDDKV